MSAIAWPEGLDPAAVAELVDRALAEDLGSEDLGGGVDVTSAATIPADLILLAMGFVGPRKAGLLEQAGVTLDARGNVAADTVGYATSEPNVFACGDMRRGQSLVVWAIREGRQAARAVDEALMGFTELPR